MPSCVIRPVTFELLPLAYDSTLRGCRGWRGMPV